MKPSFIVLSSLVLLSSLAVGQAPMTKIHLLNNSSWRQSYHFLTTLNMKEPIRVDYGQYVIVETDADTLDLFIRNHTVKVPFERGKRYFFRLGSIYEGPNNVEEMSEQAFWINAALSAYRQPRHYFLKSDKGLTELTQKR